MVRVVHGVWLVGCKYGACAREARVPWLLVPLGANVWLRVVCLYHTVCGVCTAGVIVLAFFLVLYYTTLHVLTVPPLLDVTVPRNIRINLRMDSTTYWKPPQPQWEPQSNYTSTIDKNLSHTRIWSCVDHCFVLKLQLSKTGKQTPVSTITMLNIS